MPPLTPGEGIQRPLLGFRGLLTLVMHINSCRPTHIDTKIISLFQKKKNHSCWSQTRLKSIQGQDASNPSEFPGGKRGRQEPAGVAVRALPSALEGLQGEGVQSICVRTPPSSANFPPDPGPSRARAAPLCTAGPPRATPGRAGLPLRGWGHEWARQLGQINT